MDVFGQALRDYLRSGTSGPLILHNSYDEAEEMPVDIFFRTASDLPDLEKRALEECRGLILDIGAGVGSHALILQEKGLDVTALDTSKAAIQIMKQRGVKKVVHADFLTVLDLAHLHSKYDTLLFLMNGIGITGTLPGLKDFLGRASRLLRPGGQLLFDTSDVRYLYEESSLPADRYYGEVSYQYEYQSQKGAWFNWVYVDPHTLQDIAVEIGWRFEVLFDDLEDQYLIRLTKS